jgi:hypothetical protein
MLVGASLDSEGSEEEEVGESENLVIVGRVVK